ncbi:MAG: hypothetical protein KAZ30_01610 [Candidatus Magasanikbacteria bacterium]|nr:hypothetical protein [Candidatus Magasanikbacteria bacterium]
MIFKEQLEILQKGINTYMPVLGEFFDYKKTLAEHSERITEQNPDPTHLERQVLIAQTIKNELQRLYNIENNFPEPPFAINIVDHHAVLTHPILTATNITVNAKHLLETGVKKPSVVFSSAIVPPNNFLNKKGIHLHGKSVSFFSGKEIHQAAYCMPKHDFHFIERLKQNKQWAQFTTEEQNFLEKIESEILAISMDQAINYADQVGLINNWLWPKLFAPELRDNLPELTYIPSEEIIRLNIENIFNGKSNIDRALFDPEQRTKVLELFKDVSGCWTKSGDKGTHFFWYKDKDNKPEAMRLENEQLVAVNSNVIIPFTRETIITAIKEKQIIPSLFVIYGWIVFWCGVKPLSGYGSSTYLTNMKKAWTKLLEHFDQEEKERVSKIDTKSLVGGEIVTYKRVDSKLIPQCAFDVLYDGGLTRNYVEHLNQMKFGNLVKPSMPEVYNSYVPQSERENMKLTPNDMLGADFDWIV